jgi:ribosomal-protein-alanine N-acetyltransferase
MADKTKGKTTGQKLGDLIIAFGSAMGDVLDDPKVKEKAKELSQVVVDAAAKAIGDRVKDQEAKDKVRAVSKVATDFGKSLEDHFKTERAGKAGSNEPVA